MGTPLLPLLGQLQVLLDRTLSFISDFYVFILELFDKLMTLLNYFLAKCLWVDVIPVKIVQDTAGGMSSLGPALLLT
jgi:hypothetical protein